MKIVNLVKNTAELKLEILSVDHMGFDFVIIFASSH